MTTENPPSNTPETDSDATLTATGLYVTADFARNLERQRDFTRDCVAQLKTELNALRADLADYKLAIERAARELNCEPCRLFEDIPGATERGLAEFERLAGEKV